MTWKAWFLKSWRTAVWGLLALALLSAVLWHYRQNLDWQAVVEKGRSIPAGWFIAGFLVLPIFGFPISLLLVLAGARFGTPRGMLLATGGMFFHELVVYQLAHGWLRERLTGRLKRSGLAIPEVPGRHHVWFTALFAAIQGPPYTLKLYLLNLTDIPLRVHLLAGAPVYSLFCLVGISAGSAASGITPQRIYLTLGLVLLFMILGRFLKRRFGRRVEVSGETPTDR